MSNLIYEDETVKVYIEETPLGPMFHCDSLKWTKEIVYHYDEILQELLKQLEDKGFPYLLAPIKDTEFKLQKFAKLFGFNPTDTMSLYADGERRIWICHKQSHS